MPLTAAPARKAHLTGVCGGQVDFVFTYACVNGEGGSKGNKSMSVKQLELALKGA